MHSAGECTKKLLEVAEHWATSENVERCKVCREACEDDGEETPCEKCPWVAPELWTENVLSWVIYQRVWNCRRGDISSQLDWEVLFRLMDLEGLESDAQGEVFDDVVAIEVKRGEVKEEERKREEEANRNKK